MCWKALALGVASAFALTPSLYANSITTTFFGENGFTGDMFDLTVGANGVTINGLGVNVSSGSFSIDVYIKSGTYVGSQTNASAWTLISAMPVVSSGPGVETAFSVIPYSLSAGSTYGMYVTIDDPSGSAETMYYTSGGHTYSNADLTLTAGNGVGGIFGSHGVYSPRTWNGEIDYSLTSAVAATPEPATLLLTASGLSSLLYARRRRLKA